MSKQDPNYNNPLCDCGHRKNQHSVKGCGWEEERNGKWVKCTCKRKFTQFK